MIKAVMVLVIGIIFLVISFMMRANQKKEDARKDTGFEGRSPLLPGYFYYRPAADPSGGGHDC